MIVGIRCGEGILDFRVGGRIRTEMTSRVDLHPLTDRYPAKQCRISIDLPEFRRLCTLSKLCTQLSLGGLVMSCSRLLGILALPVVINHGGLDRPDVLGLRPFEISQNFIPFSDYISPA